jgi:hypothetical protein
MEGRRSRADACFSRGAAATVGLGRVLFGCRVDLALELVGVGIHLLLDHLVGTRDRLLELLLDLRLAEHDHRGVSQNSVNSLKSVQLGGNTASTLKTDLQKVQSNANAVVSSAKQDFPSQTSALESSVTSLSTSVKALPPAPTPQQLVPIKAEVASTVSAADSLKSATSSACD